MSSDVLKNSLLKKRDQSDVDPKEFKRTIRTSLIPPNFNLITSIKFLDFSTLYTTIPTRNMKIGSKLSYRTSTSIKMEIVDTKFRF